MKLLWSILFLALPAFSQSTNATVSGTMLDPAGARVPNVQVMAENVNTGVVLTTTTNEAGVYVFPSVQPGQYRLTVEAAGFRKYVLNGVTVEVAGRIDPRGSSLRLRAPDRVRSPLLVVRHALRVP